MIYQVSYRSATLSSAVLIEAKTAAEAKTLFVAMSGGSVSYVQAKKWKGI